MILAHALVQPLANALWHETVGMSNSSHSVLKLAVMIIGTKSISYGDWASLRWNALNI
jgi:hypothetical protein